MLMALLAAILLAGSHGTAPHTREGVPPEQPTIELPWCFTDHMVLQQGLPVRVWGTTGPNQRVSVTFGGDEVAALSDAAGAWSIELPVRSASAEGSALIVTSPSHQVRLEDVVVGEVWLCAGQSNMDFALKNATGGREAAASAPTEAPLVRLCNRTGSPGGGLRRALTPEELARISKDDYYHGEWQTISPERAAPFSAVGYFFGADLQAALGVPIGLIDVSIGGSSTEGWVAPASLRADPLLAPLAKDFLGTDQTHPFIKERTEAQLGAWIQGDRQGPRPRHFFEPGFLYSSAVETLAPFPVQGVLWYQGESNATRPQLADQLFRTMVQDWRGLWQRPDLPFYYVQLPGMLRPSWPAFREVQASWLDLPHSHMAVTIDVGAANDVHPKNKRPVGERLALLALRHTYGQEVIASGPVASGQRVEGASLVIEFEHASGLAWAEGRGPTGFEIAGKDQRFYPAVAELNGREIRIASPNVEQPTAARYAWAPFPEWSLVNAEGLPAAPFHTHP